MPGAGTTRVTGTLVLEGHKTLDRRRLDNTGTVRWAGGNITLANDGQITNSGTFRLTEDSEAVLGTLSGSGSFTNTGRIEKYGTSTYQIDVYVDHRGTEVEVNAGRLTFRGGGFANGTFDVAGVNGTLDFYRGPNGEQRTYQWNGATFTGAGTAQLNTTARVGDSGPVQVNVATFNFINGAIDGTGTINFSRTLNWSGGTMTGGGTTNITAGTTTIGTDTVPDLLVRAIDARIVNIEALATVNLGGFTNPTSLVMANGSTLNNRGRFYFRDDSDVLHGEGERGTFYNYRLVEKTGGTGVSEIQPDYEMVDPQQTINRAGRIRVRQRPAGATLMRGGEVLLAGGDITIEGPFDHLGGSVRVEQGQTLTVNGDYNQAAGAVNVVWGTLAVSGGNFRQTGGIFVTEFGTVSLTHDFILDGGTAESLYGSTTINGQLRLNSGLFRFKGDGLTALGGVHIASGGSMVLEAYYGQINANVTNAGTLSLGSRAESYGGDWLTIAGNYTQTATGRLVMDLRSHGHDTLTVTGTATLGGTFEVVVEPGYEPPFGEFSLISYAARDGVFASTMLPPGWEAVYGETGPGSVSVRRQYY